MKKLSKGLVLLVAFVMMISLFSGCSKANNTSSSSSSESKKIKIGVVVKALNSDYWNEVKAGAVDAGKELGVDVTVVGPNSESDFASEINMIEDQITKGVSALCIAPSQPSAINPTLEKADAAKIPVLMIDTDANWDKKKAFVGTGNFKGGQIAGDFIAQKVGKGAEVAIIRGLLGDATHDARANGAIQELKAAGVNVVTIQPADSDRNKGMTVMQNILQTHPNIKAVFGTNDEMILGALRALQAAKKTDVITVGFDGSPDGLKSVIAGELTATVAQDAYGIGKMGVENAVKVAKGETIDKVIDTGTTLIDKSNAQALQDKIQKELGK